MACESACTTPLQITIKKGDTFSVLATYKDDAGDPINLTTEGITITSQIRDYGGNLIEDLDVAILDQSLNTGNYTITADTALWPLSGLYWDIEYLQGAVKTSTDTIKIKVVQGVTE